MIRVLVVDDHPVMRAGLRACLRSEPGLIPVGTVENGDTAVDAADSLRADLVLLDLHVPGGGLRISRRLKALPQPPKVLLYTAFADEGLLVPARIAGADGVLSKESGQDALFETIRRIHADGCVMPAPAPDQVRATMRTLDVDEQPIAAMLLAGFSPADVAGTLRRDVSDLETQLEDMLGRLQHRSL